VPRYSPIALPLGLTLVGAIAYGYGLTETDCRRDGGHGVATVVGVILLGAAIYLSARKVSARRRVPGIAATATASLLVVVAYMWFTWNWLGCAN
jgi:hypothetical protein